MSTEENTAFDGIFMNALERSQGIENFFDRMFAFIKRKTDLYDDEVYTMGVINSTVQKHMKSYKEVKQQRDQAELQRKIETEKEAMLKSEHERKLIEVERLEAQQRVQEGAAKRQEAFQNGQQLVLEEDARRIASSFPSTRRPDATNGGQTSTYSWEQTRQEITLNIPIPASTTSKQLNIDIQKTHLKVGIKNQEPFIVDGALTGQIKKGDSIWCVETDNKQQKIVQINLTKKVEGFWKCAIVGDAEIAAEEIKSEINTAADMQKLNPDDRQFVEQMMHNERAKINGTSQVDPRDASFYELQMPAKETQKQPYGFGRLANDAMH